jgi:hypothetical protein
VRRDFHLDGGLKVSPIAFASVVDNDYIAVRTPPGLLGGGRAEKLRFFFQRKFGKTVQVRSI